MLASVRPLTPFVADLRAFAENRVPRHAFWAILQPWSITRHAFMSPHSLRVPSRESGSPRKRLAQHISWGGALIGVGALARYQGGIAKADLPLAMAALLACGVIDRQSAEQCGQRVQQPS